jgi:hypothetical protein
MQAAQSCTCTLTCDVHVRMCMSCACARVEPTSSATLPPRDGWRGGYGAVGNKMGSSSRVFSAAISAWLTASHPNSEVKQVRAGVVLRWGTTREGPVLRFLFSLSPSPPFVSLSPSPPSPSLDFCSRVSSSVCRRTLRAHHQHRWMDWRLGPKVERARPEACLPVLLRGFVLLCTSTHTSLCALHWPALP